MNLPPLPPGFDTFYDEIDKAEIGVFSADQMQAYGQQCAKDAMLRVLALIPGGPTMDPMAMKSEILEMLK